MNDRVVPKYKYLIEWLHKYKDQTEWYQIFGHYAEWFVKQLYQKLAKYVRTINELFLFFLSLLSVLCAAVVYMYTVYIKPHDKNHDRKKLYFGVYGDL